LARHFADPVDLYSDCSGLFRDFLASGVQPATSSAVPSAMTGIDVTTLQPA
jgi:hypothetical protein